MDFRRSLLCFIFVGVLAVEEPAAPAESSRAPATVDEFLRPPAKDLAKGLPADGIWPKGRRMLWAGYSGKPERDLAQGFSVVGPAYGVSNQRQVEDCGKAGLPVIAQVGGFETLAGGKWETVASVPLDEVRRRTAGHVRSLAKNRSIIMWAVQPEELRPWRADEMAYLKAVTETIRANDPLGRPIFMYNPNNRDVTTLANIAPQLDVVAKGCYATAHGHKDDRGWVRWSVEQLVASAAKGRPGSWALVMPALSSDPDEKDLPLIRPWVRHDCYLGLMAGAKGMLTWSLFPRPEVKKTWQTWYDAYAECGREINGPKALGEVFLFGEPRDDLAVAPDEPRPPHAMNPGVKSRERNTTRAMEGAFGMIHLWTKAEYQLGDRHFLFLANSSPSATSFKVRGIPSAGLAARDAFDGHEVALPAAGSPLELRLVPWEIRAIEFRRR